jgi:hypothetical protein
VALGKRKQDPAPPAAAAWWQVLSGFLAGPLDAAGLVELLGGLLPAARWCEARLDDSREARGEEDAAGTRLEAVLVVRGLARGRLTVVLPAEAQEGEPVLALAARLAEQRLALADLAEWHRQAANLLTMGEAAGGLVHAINNHLNSMLMQAMLVQMRPQDDARERAVAIRKEGQLAAASTRAAQTIQPWMSGEPAQADLTAAARQALAAEPDLARRVHSDLSDEAVLVRGSPWGLERLVGLVLRVGLRCLPPGSSATLTIEGQGLALRLPLAGDSTELPPETLPGIGELEREAAHWLARQLGGREEFERLGKELAWRVNWEPPS